MTNRKTLSAQSVSATILFIFLVAAFSLQSQLLQSVYAVIATVVVLANINNLNSLSEFVRSYVLVLIATLALMLPFNILNDGGATVYYYITIVSLLLAIVMIRDFKIYYLASRWILMIIQGIIMLYLLHEGLDDYPLENIIPNSSSNGVTSYLILLQASYSLASFLYKRETAIFTTLITLCICIVGYGRASLFAAMCLLLISFIFLMAQYNWKINITYALISILISIALYFTFYDQISVVIENNTKIGHGFYDQARYLMTKDYIKKLDKIGLLIGVDYSNTLIARLYNGNPHSSYIRAHSIFGLFYLIAILILPVLSVLKQSLLSAKIFGALILLVILFRCLTETLLFPTVFDFFYFAICFALMAPPQDRKSKS